MQHGYMRETDRECLHEHEQSGAHAEILMGRCGVRCSDMDDDDDDDDDEFDSDDEGDDDDDDEDDQPAGGAARHDRITLVLCM
jgi:hypothetical protein